MPDTNNLIALSKLLHVSVEYLATGKTNVQESNTNKKGPPAALGNTAVCLYLLPILLNIIGYAAGVFEMLMFPMSSRGDRIGIWLGYGDSVFAIVLIVLEVISILSAIILTIIHFSLERKNKSQPVE